MLSYVLFKGSQRNKALTGLLPVLPFIYTSIEQAGPFCSPSISPESWPILDHQRMSFRPARLQVTLSSPQFIPTDSLPVKAFQGLQFFLCTNCQASCLFYVPQDLVWCGSPALASWPRCHGGLGAGHEVTGAGDRQAG